MKNIKMMIMKGLFALALSTCFFQGFVHGCSNDSKNDNYLVEEDAMGRLIVLWLDVSAGGSLNISIDNREQNTISLPGQACLSPLMGITEEGHIVVVWAGKIPGKEVYTLYGAKLPYKGKWSTPEIITDPDEWVILTSHKLKVVDSNKIHVFWEAMSYSPSEINPELLAHQRHLRCLKGSFKAWGSPKNVALLHEGK